MIYDLRMRIDTKSLNVKVKRGGASRGPRSAVGLPAAGYFRAPFGLLGVGRGVRELRKGKAWRLSWSKSPIWLVDKLSTRTTTVVLATTFCRDLRIIYTAQPLVSEPRR